MREPLPGRRAVLRGGLVGVGAWALSACSGDPYRQRPGAGGATTGVVPPAPATGRRVDFQGTTYDVPTRARRVVTIGDACLQPVLDMGGPVVATSAVAPATVPPSRRPALRELPTLGSGRATDPITVGLVMEHQPDLVLAVAGTSADLVRQVGARVPVVVVHTDGDERFAWQQRVRGIGELLGADDPGAPEAAFRDRLERIRRRHQATLEGTGVVVLRAWDTRRISAYGPESVPGKILAGAGARFVPSVTGARAEQGEVQDSLGQVETYLEGAGVVMLASDYSGGLDAFTGGSLATSDPVTGHVRRTGAVLMGAGVLTVFSYAQAHFMLDRFEEALLQVAAGR